LACLWFFFIAFVFRLLLLVLFFANQFVIAFLIRFWCDLSLIFFSRIGDSRVFALYPCVPFLYSGLLSVCTAAFLSIPVCLVRLLSRLVAAIRPVPQSGPTCVSHLWPGPAALCFFALVGGTAMLCSSCTTSAARRSAAMLPLVWPGAGPGAGRESPRSGSWVVWSDSDCLVTLAAFAWWRDAGLSSDPDAYKDRPPDSSSTARSAMTARGPALSIWVAMPEVCSLTCRRAQGLQCVSAFQL